MTNNKETKQKSYTGTVVSDSMDKTIVVKVDTAKMHPKYKKQYVSTKKYKVHDERNEAKKGDTVIFQDSRPLSKDKRWRLISIK